MWVSISIAQNASWIAIACRWKDLHINYSIYTVVVPTVSVDKHFHHGFTIAYTMKYQVVRSCFNTVNMRNKIPATSKKNKKHFNHAMEVDITKARSATTAWDNTKMQIWTGALEYSDWTLFSFLWKYTYIFGLITPPLNRQDHRRDRKWVWRESGKDQEPTSGPWHNRMPHQSTE